MRDYLSFSQVSMFLRCGKSYEFRYLENKKIPPGIAMIKGSSVHGGIEFNSIQKIQSRIDLPKSDIVDAAVTAFNTQITEEIQLSDDERGIGKKEIIGRAKDSVVTISELYVDSVAPTIQPIEVEKTIMIDIPDSQPIMAVLDCIDEKHVVHDYKVTGKSKNQNEADTSLQLSVYAMAHKELYGTLPKKLVLDTMVELKTPKYQAIETTRDEDCYVKIYRISQAVQKAIAAGIFLPPAEGSWNCSSRFCGYYDICEFVQTSIF